MSNRTRLSLSAAALTLLLAATACAGATTSGGDDDDPTSTGAIPHPTGADQVVLRESTGGGFVPMEYNLSSMPGFTLYGDGTVLTQGPMIEIYPPPAMPNIQQQTVTEEGIQAILQAADEAGLLSGDHQYDAMTQYVADVGTTTFTVTTDQEYETSIYALGMSSGEGDMTFDIPAEDKEADEKLAAFSAKLFDLTSWLPEGSVSEFTEYEPSEMRVFVSDYGKPIDEELTQEPIDWPLSTPLADFDEGVDAGSGMAYGCGTVSGPDLATLMPIAQGTNTQTPWVSEGEEYRLIFRPLLPDESGC